MGSLPKTFLIPVNYRPPFSTVESNTNSTAPVPIRPPVMLQLNGQPASVVGNFVSSLPPSSAVSSALPSPVNQGEKVKLSTTKPATNQKDFKKGHIFIAPKLSSNLIVNKMPSGGCKEIRMKQPNEKLSVKTSTKRKAEDESPDDELPAPKKKNMASSVLAPDTGSDLIGEPRVLIQRMSPKVLKTFMSRTLTSAAADSAPSGMKNTCTPTSHASDKRTGVAKNMENAVMQASVKTLQGMTIMQTNSDVGQDASKATPVLTASFTDIWKEVLYSSTETHANCEDSSKDTGLRKEEESYGSQQMKDYMDIPEFEVASIKSEPDTSEYERHSSSYRGVVDEMQINGEHVQITMNQSQDQDIKPDISDLAGYKDTEDPEPTPELDVKPTIELVDDNGKVTKVRFVEELPGKTHQESMGTAPKSTVPIQKVLGSPCIAQALANSLSLPHSSTMSKQRSAAIPGSSTFQPAQDYWAEKGPKSYTTHKPLHTPSLKCASKPTSNTAVYSCGHCLKSFQHHQGYLLHQRKIHKSFFTRNVFSFKHCYLMAFKEEGSQKKTFYFSRRKFSCMLCFRTFRRRTDLRFHQRLCHSNKGSMSESQQLGERSLEMNLRPKASKKIVCEACSARFKSKKDLILHQAKQHGLGEKFAAKKVHCTVCNKIYQHKELLRDHILREHGETVHCCPHDSCDFTYGDFWTVRAHIKASHPRNHSCGTCSWFKSSNDTAFQQHMKQHNVFRMTAKCPIKECNFISKKRNRQSIQSHLAEKHGMVNKEAIWCPIAGCNFVSLWHSNMKRHLVLQHPESSYFSCQKCEKIFKTHRSLKHHCKTWHSMGDLQIFHCTGCVKKFRSLSAYRKHLKVCGKGKFMSCLMCDYRTNEEMALNNHLFCRHGVQIPDRNIYTCSVCGYKTIVRAIMKKHISVHKPHKEHKCLICKKEFRLPYQLKAHLAVHSDEHPFCCTFAECDFKTKTARRLRQHIRIRHEMVNAKPFKCPYCEHRSNLRGNCIKHVSRVHPNMETRVIKLFNVKE